MRNLTDDDPRGIDYAELARIKDPTGIDYAALADAIEPRGIDFSFLKPSYFEKVFLDFETTSKVSLTVVDAYNYAADPSTQVLLCSYKIDNNPIEILDFTQDPEGCAYALAEIVNSSKKVYAWNAQFDRLIFQKTLAPYTEPAKLEPWFCVSSFARAHGLVGKLSGCANVINELACAQLVPLKDEEGEKLMRKFSRYTDEIYPELPQEFINYCVADTQSLYSIYNFLSALGIVNEKQHHKSYTVSEAVNEYGVRIDIDFTRGAAELEQKFRIYVNEQLTALTGIRDPKPMGKAVKDWLTQRLSKVADIYSVWTGKFAVKDRRDVLTAFDGKLPENTQEVLKLIDSTQGSACKKYKGFLEVVNPETNRLQGRYMHYGALTGRFKSFRPQLQNLVRDVASKEEAKRIKEDVTNMYIRPTLADDLGRMLRRNIICDKGNILIGADYAQIEARITLWLAARARLEGAADKLARYAAGEDIYIHTAESILGHVLAEGANGKRQRQVFGKVPELALGFGGGLGALARIGDLYGEQFEVDQCKKIYERYHQSNPWVRPLMKRIEDTFRARVNTDNDFMRLPWGYEFIRTPLGLTVVCNVKELRTQIVYQHVTQAPDGALQFMRPDSKRNMMVASKLWGGVLIENMVQASAASILRRALIALYDVSKDIGEPFRVVLHTHDEIVMEVPEDSAEDYRRLLTDCMKRATPCNVSAGVDLPIDVETWQGYDYGDSK